MYLQVESIFDDVRKQIEDSITNVDAEFDPSAVALYTSDLLKYLDEATEEGTHKLRVYLQERYKEALENVISKIPALVADAGVVCMLTSKVCAVLFTLRMCCTNLQVATNSCVARIGMHQSSKLLCWH